ncbi:hypothetical protein I2F27_11345 [Acinetobacter sp. B5B]|uniref:hypothetical protein n=1 Tax=Acinetobacter baretiae TaxID=2605383 RepID=UPI0018C21609|nr:hypothetical protein [Acinetobacter baretiae]MBF7683914.1 hypothetical protein [Acinetobacter baretiae]
MLGKASNNSPSTELSKIGLIQVIQNNNLLEILYWAEKNIQEGLQVIQPNGKSNAYDLLLSDLNNPDHKISITAEQEGIYKISANFSDIYTPVYYKVSKNTFAPNSPEITSIIRDQDNVVHIKGRSTEVCVITLISDESNDVPIAYAPVTTNKNEFSFSIKLPIHFSGYLRSQNSTYASIGTPFQI